MGNPIQTSIDNIIVIPDECFFCDDKHLHIRMNKQGKKLVVTLDIDKIVTLALSQGKQTTILDENGQH